MRNSTLVSVALALAVLTSAAPGSADTPRGRLFPNEPPDALVGLDFRLPAGENLVLSRRTAVQSESILALPEGLALLPGVETNRPLRPVASGDTLASFGQNDNETRSTRLLVNYRSSTYVPSLATLRIAVGDSSGYAGSPGPQSRWSAELDQWIAMLDEIRPSPVR